MASPDLFWKHFMIVFNRKILERFENKFLYLFNSDNGAILKLSSEAILEYYKYKREYFSQGKIEAIEDISLFQVLKKERFLFSQSEKEKRGDKEDFVSNRRGLQSDFAPFAILWEITNHCNLRCVYCHADIKKRAQNCVQDLALEKLLFIADQLIDSRVFEFILTGGEIFTRREEALLLIKYLKEHNRSVAVVTNGMLMDEALAERLSSLNVSVGISLDASSELLQKKTRGMGVFRKVVEAIKILRHFEIFPNVICTLTRYNFDDLENFLKLVRELGIRSVAIQNLIPNSDPQIYHSLKLTRQQEDSLSETICRIRKDFQDLLINFTEVDTFVHQQIPLQKANGRDHYLMSGCSACTRGALVDANGVMYPCTSLRMLPLGNLLEEDVFSLWHNTGNARFVRKLQGETNNAIPQCESCCWKSCCNTGCRGEAYALHSDWYALHDRCPMRYVS